MSKEVFNYDDINALNEGDLYHYTTGLQVRYCIRGNKPNGFGDDIFSSEAEAAKYKERRARINKANEKHAKKLAEQEQKEQAEKLARFETIRNGGKAKLNPEEFEEYCNKYGIELHLRTIGSIRKWITSLTFDNNRCISMFGHKKCKSEILFGMEF